MSDYRTVIKPQKSPFSLKWGEPVYLMGSCFSDNIGERLKRAGYDTLSNPFGAQYNPHSIHVLLERVAENRQYGPADLHEHDGMHFSFEANTNLSHPMPEFSYDQLNSALSQTRKHLANCPTVIITLGSAWYYTFREQQKIVANCFKIPKGAFDKTMFNVAEVQRDLELCVEHIRKLSPQANIIFTLSPIRHWKDGATENALSKATLRLGIENVCKSSDAFYFPAYELMIDDLRDYRFYEDDMLHPTQVAVDYIWQHFRESCLDPTDDELVERMLSLHQARMHRPFNLTSPAHIEFVKRQIAEVELLEQKQKLDQLQKLRVYFKGRLF